MYEGSLTDVRGLRVGHAQDDGARTGVTAILCPEGTVGGVSVRGAAPGTRETDLLRPGASVRGPHAVLLGGGSAFGLAAADGAMCWLEEMGVGVQVGPVRVPIVPMAIIFDLLRGRADIRPDAAMGYAACGAASDGPVVQGAVGAGCGATVGKLVPGGVPSAGGLGSASLLLPNGYTVAALAVVNAAGDVYDPRTNALLASATAEGRPVTAEGMLLDGGALASPLGRNTTIGVVATDAPLTKEQVNRLADVAHDGLARAVRPAHTEADGDTIFALATGGHPAAVSETVSLCAAAAEAFARAVANAVRAGQ